MFVDLLHSRRENLRLCDQISNLEKEVIACALHYLNFHFISIKIALGDIDKDHRPKDVKTVIVEMEEKHGETNFFVSFSI